MPMGGSDGLELLTRISLMYFIFLVLGSWIGNTAMIQNAKPLFTLLRSDHIVWNVGLGLVWGYAVLNCFVTATLFLLITMNYAHSMAIYLRKIT